MTQLPPPAPDGPRNPHDSNLVEPRNPNRLQIDVGTWNRVSSAYLAVEVVSTIVTYLVLVGVGIGLATGVARWIWIPTIIVAVIAVVHLVITPRQVRAIGYQLRDDDLVFRRGIMWQRIVAVPYGRMQIVDITRGPLARMLGLAELKMVTAAAATGVSIPGLPVADAESLRDRLVAVAETRRMGL